MDCKQWKGPGCTGVATCTYNSELYAITLQLVQDEDEYLRYARYVWSHRAKLICWLMLDNVCVPTSAHICMTACTVYMTMGTIKYSCAEVKDLFAYYGGKL